MRLRSLAGISKCTTGFMLIRTLLSSSGVHQARLLHFPEMTVILQGSLRHFPPWQLLPFLACSVDLAVLQVERSAPARLWLRDRQAMWGESLGGNDVVAATA